MYLYNSVNYLNKYNNIYDILEEFYKVRYTFYEKRKEHLMNTLENVLNILDTKVKFINDIINKTLDLSNKEKEDIIKIFENKKFYKIKDEPEYDYLLRMPFYSLTKTKVNELNNMFNKKKKEYNELKKKSPSEIWTNDLNNLLKVL